ncbi:LysE family translocator [Cucumibacter marinus]|uniref:LysE family translocator n=1 Tax=Cucumibacter marinus TaxID=1121252 RepID=UPI000407B927|nr:LysE family translocator [Cucumibacter marinus]
MPSLDLILAFVLALLIFAAMPGPAMLYTAARTIAGGRRAGMMAALGLHTGGYVHVIAVTLGLAVLFHAVPALYTALKIVGAAYLIWLGWRLIRPGKQADDGMDTVSARPVTSGRRAFLQSIVVEILNPKTAIFYLSFLPQFVDPSASLPIWAQFLILGTIVNLGFTIGDLICVVLAGLVVEKLRKSARAAAWTRRIGGGVLIGLGANLALNRG